KLGEDLTNPYNLTWSNVTAGNYTLRAVVTGNGGVTATSSPVAITVVTNFAPTVSLTAPHNNAVFATPTNITVAANANDSEGTIAKVEFYQGNSKFAEDTTSPYSVTFTNPSPGFYTLTAIAYDNVGTTATSGPVSITVNSSGAPSTNTLISLGSLWK